MLKAQPNEANDTRAHGTAGTMSTMHLEQAENNRRKVLSKLAGKRRSQLGQFMTPATVARFMAAMFPPMPLTSCKLLDAGAGLGALTCAFLDRWLAGGFEFSCVETTAHEFDDTLREHLQETLARYGDRARFGARVIPGDFIMQTALAMVEGRAPRMYTHAILNPPYKKINNDSDHRRALRQVGIETVNLYSAFVALTIDLMAPGGTVVAIIPRSFCNGTYYEPFRRLMLQKTALRAMHLFESRDKAFKDDEVLQENVIIMLERDGKQGEVIVTTSTDDSFSDLRTYVHSFDRIVFPDGTEIHQIAPTTTEETELSVPATSITLDQIGVKVVAVCGLSTQGSVTRGFRGGERANPLPDALCIGRGCYMADPGWQEGQRNHGE